MDKVKVDLQCPFCGYCRVMKMSPSRKGMSCPACKQSIFLRWATGIEGELDEHGYYYHAYEPFNLPGINREFKEVFEDDYKPKSSYKINNKK